MGLDPKIGPPGDISLKGPPYFPALLGFREREFLLWPSSRKKVFGTLPGDWR